jgi:autotransporter-associated beta strand protein
MKSSTIIFTLVGAFLLCLALVVRADQGNLINAVPDWNQWFDYYGTQDYPNWCSPTAGANIMGYWDDVMGRHGLADGTSNIYPNTPVYPGTPLTWQQGLWHDGNIEMGWFMDTGSWRTTNPLNFPPFNGGTPCENIGPGLLAYAAASWTDPNPLTGPISKTAFPDTTVFTHALGQVPNLDLNQMWNTYKHEIDNGRPIEVSFERWILPGNPQGVMQVNGATVQTYQWNPSKEPHSVVGVGYIDDPISGQWFICQDGWGNTARFVGVPRGTNQDTKWVQNDYLWSGQTKYQWIGGDAFFPIDWGKNTNWNYNNVPIPADYINNPPPSMIIPAPNSAGAEVTFGLQNPLSNIVDLGTDGRTVGSIIFNPMTSTTIQSSGGHTLTLDNCANNAILSVSGMHIISADIALNSDADITVSGSLNIGGAISDGWKGAKGINKSGSGLLVLAGNNTYTGATNVNQGIIVVQGLNTQTNAIGDTSAVTIAPLSVLDLVGHTETIGTLAGGGNILLRSGGNLTINQQADTMYSGVISDDGGGSIIKNGASKLILTANAIFAGSTTINDGTLQLGNNGTTGSVLGSIAINNASLIFDRSNDYTFTAGIQGTAILVSHIGDGKLTLQGNANYAGATIFGSGGGLVIEDTHFQSSITIDNSIKPSNTLELNYNSNAWFIRGAISGNGVLEKTGTGQAILTADNSGYTGPLNIGAGQIQVRNSLALGNTSNLVTVSAGGVLSSDVNGAISSYTVGNNLTLDGVSGSLAGGYLSVQNADTNYTGAIAAVGDGVQMGHISSSQLNGKLFIDGNLVGINSLNLTSGGSGDPMTYTGAVQFRGTSTKSFSGPINIVRERLELNVTGTNAFNSTDVTIGSGTGSSRGVLMLMQNDQIPDTAAITFKNTSGNYGYFRLNGDSETVASISDLTGRAFIENIDSGHFYDYPANPTSILTLAGNADYTFAGRIRDNYTGNSPLALVKNGSSTFILAGSATNSGGIQVNNGKLQIGNSTSGGVLSSPVTLNNSTSIVFNNSSSAIATSSISGSTGSIVQRGAGVTRISGNNSYGGGTFIENGKLVATQPSSLQGKVTFNGNGTLSVGAIANTVGGVTGFGGSGPNWTINRRDSGGAPASSIANDVLTITTADNQEARSAFFNKPVSIKGFEVHFTYTALDTTTPIPADGIAFVLQNDLRGVNAVGDSGGKLGYGGASNLILPSFAMELDIFERSTAWAYNGGTGGYIPQNPMPWWVYSPTNPTPMDITLTYDGVDLLFFQMTDGVNSMGYFMHNQYLRNLLGDTAYLGFTGGTGADNVKQTISNFSYTATDASFSTTYTNNLVVAAGVTGNVDVSRRTVTLGNLSLAAGAGLNVATESDITPNTIYTLSLGTASLAGSGSIGVANNGAGKGTLRLAGPISGAGGTLAKTDAGTLSIAGGINQGALTLLDIQNGTVDLTTTGVSDSNLDVQTALSGKLLISNQSHIFGDISGTGTTEVSSGQLTATSISQNTLTIGAGSTVTIAPIPGGPLAEPGTLSGVPEPSSLVLLGVGISVFPAYALQRRRRTVFKYRA